MAGNFGRGSSKAARTARRNARLAAKTGTNRYGKLNIKVDAKQIAKHLANHKIAKALGLSGIGNWVANKVPKWGSFNQSLKTRVKAGIGEKNYRSTSANNPGSGVMPSEVLKFYERYNPDGKTKQDFEERYANQLNEGISLEQAMANNPAETMSYYALLDLDDEASTQQNTTTNDNQMAFNWSDYGITPSAHGNTNAGIRDNIDRLYQHVVGRGADPTGRDYWADKISSGTDDWNTLLSGLTDSNEYKDRNLMVQNNPNVTEADLDQLSSAWKSGVDYELGSDGFSLTPNADIATGTGLVEDDTAEGTDDTGGTDDTEGTDDTGGGGTQVIYKNSPYEGPSLKDFEDMLTKMFSNPWTPFGYGWGGGNTQGVKMNRSLASKGSSSFKGASSSFGRSGDRLSNLSGPQFNI